MRNFQSSQTVGAGAFPAKGVLRGACQAESVGWNGEQVLIIHMNQPLDVLKIDTPENVTFSYEVSGIGSRFLAALVDTFLLGLLQGIVIGTVLLILSQLGSGNSSNSSTDFGSQAGWWIFGILAFVSFLFFWGYYIFFEIFWNGQTPGKRWIGLRVIRLDGTPVGVSEVVIRNLVRTLDLLPTAYGVGVITMFINSNSCRLGDLAAGTVVVHDSRASLGHAPCVFRMSFRCCTGMDSSPPTFHWKRSATRICRCLSFLLTPGRAGKPHEIWRCTCCSPCTGGSGSLQQIRPSRLIPSMRWLQSIRPGRN